MFSGHWMFRNRGVMAHLPLVVVLLSRQRETANLAVDWSVALFLLFAGTALRIWAQSYIHHRLKMPLQLTTSGPYQLARNPLSVTS
jgi:protein-S-isoprenylcysteine O-methyltransferase Ste14